MSFGNLPLAAVIAGAIALALSLFLLQWLRSRTKVIQVATSQFWQQALQQAPARVWWQKFRYLLAWLLSVAIALLLWLALSGVQLSGSGNTPTAFYFIDSSAAMTAAEHFVDAKQQLRHDVAASDSQHRQVWLGGAVATLLLNSGDNNALLSAKLANIDAQIQSSSWSQWLVALRQDTADDAAVDVYYYGPSLSRSELAAIPSNITLHNRYVAPAITHNLGIVALGQTPAQSGLWGKVDVQFSLYASDDRPLTAQLVKFALDGQWFQPANIRALGAGRFVIADLDVANAPQQLQLSLATSDDFSADDSASLMLASLPVVRVQLGENLPAWLNQLFSVDSGINLVSDNADVAVCASVASCSNARARLVLDADSNVAHYVGHNGDNSQDWQQALTLQWQQNGWTTLAARQQFPQLLFEQAADRREQHLSPVSLNLMLQQQRAELPLLLADSIRWLAQEQQVTPYLALSAPWPQSYAEQLSSLPLQAGQQHNLNGQAALAALSSPALSQAVTHDSSAAPTDVLDALVDAPLLSLLSWCMLLAAALLLLEWALLQRGRLP